MCVHACVRACACVRCACLRTHVRACGVRVCVRTCVRACGVRACMRACVHVCVHMKILLPSQFFVYS